MLAAQYDQKIAHHGSPAFRVKIHDFPCRELIERHFDDTDCAFDDLLARGNDC